MAGTHDIARAAGLNDENIAAVAVSILNAVAAGEKVSIKGFGTFILRQQAERTIRSPQIPGGVAIVPARQVLRFKPSPQLKDQLNVATKPKGTNVADVKPASKAAPKTAPVAVKGAVKVAAKVAPVAVKGAVKVVPKGAAKVAHAAEEVPVEEAPAEEAEG